MSPETTKQEPSTITEQLMLRLKVPTKLRNLEAFLILLAMIVTSAALALVDLGVTGQINPSIIGLTLGLGLIAVSYTHLTLPTIYSV